MRKNLGRILVLGVWPCVDRHLFPFCMVALVTMALVKWRCISKYPQCEDSVSKGAQQKQMKHLLSPQP